MINDEQMKHLGSFTFTSLSGCPNRRTGNNRTGCGRGQTGRHVSSLSDLSPLPPIRLKASCNPATHSTAFKSDFYFLFPI